MRKAPTLYDQMGGRKQPKDSAAQYHKLFTIVQRQNILYTVIQNVLCYYLCNILNIKNMTMNSCEKVFFFFLTIQLKHSTTGSHVFPPLNTK